MPCKKGQFDVVELMINDQFKTFSINLNGQHVNGMTPLICFLGMTFVILQLDQLL